MPPESNGSASAPEWLRRARSDLALAATEPRFPILYNDLCFHAQQAVEKSLKAVLISRQIAFPRTHLIELLLNLLPSTAKPVPDREALAELSVYATVARYPGDYEDTTAEEWRQAVRRAAEVVQWSEQILGDTSGH